MVRAVSLFRYSPPLSFVSAKLRLNLDRWSSWSDGHRFVAISRFTPPLSPFIPLCDSTLHSGPLIILIQWPVHLFLSPRSLFPKLSPPLIKPDRMVTASLPLYPEALSVHDLTPWVPPHLTIFTEENLHPTVHIHYGGTWPANSYVLSMPA